MKNTHTNEYDWALRVLAIEKARDLPQTPHEIFGKIYTRLTDEQKIAFILAGGIPSSFYYRSTRMNSETDTGPLPVLC